jgi:hypothetical protein
MEVSSGAKVSINVADFDDALALKNAVAKEFAQSGLELSNLKASDLQNFTEMDVNVLMPFLKAVAQFDSSPSVNAAIFACLSRSTYNSERITKETFENVEARADYYEIVFECLKVNLSPFFKGLVSKLNLAGFLTKEKAPE